MKGERLLDELRRLSGDDDISDFDDLNSAYQRILRRAKSWTMRVRDEASLQFRNGKKDYTLPMHRIARLLSIAVKENEDEKEWRTLTILPDDEFDKKVLLARANDGSEIEDTPKYYRLSAGGTDQLEVTPTPDGTYSGRLIYYGNPPPLDLEAIPLLPEMYHRTIAELAAGIRLQGSKDPGDIAKGQNLERLAKEAYWPLANDTANNMAGVKMPTQPLMRCR